MIKPIDISPDGTTNFIYFECQNCGEKKTAGFTERIINTLDEADMEILRKEKCYICGTVLGE